MEWEELDAASKDEGSLMLAEKVKAVFGYRIPTVILGLKSQVSQVLVGNTSSNEDISNHLPETTSQ